MVCQGNWAISIAVKLFFTLKNMWKCPLISINWNYFIFNVPGVGMAICIIDVYMGMYYNT